MKKITIACNSEGGQYDSQKYKQKKSDLFISIRSPSQWQLSGSCLPLLRPVVYISANASWHTNQNKVRWKFRDSCYNCQITNKTYCDWVATESCCCNLHCEKLRRVKRSFSKEQLKSRLSWRTGVAKSSSCRRTSTEKEKHNCVPA